MKRFILIGILVLSVIIIQGQVVKTGEGESSILVENTSIGFDLGKSELTFNSNNYSGSKVANNGIVWGLNLSAKNKEGTGALIGSTEFMPSSKLSGIIGVFKSNSDKVSSDINKELEAIEAKNKKDNRKNFIETIKKVIANDKVIEQFKSQVAFFNKLEKTIAGEINVRGRLLTQLRTDSANHSDARIKVLATKYIEIINNTEYSKVIFKVKKRQKDLEEDELALLKSNKYQRHTLYVQGGIKAEEFNVVTTWDTTNILNSFNEVKFNGASFGVGYNFRFGGNFMIGIKYSYEQANNTSMLKLHDYSYEVSTTNAKETITEKKTKSAYTGEYHKAHYTNIDVDFLHFTKLNKEGYIVFDYYYRYNDSDKDDIIPSHTDIGVSSSFFKSSGKFLGGLYVELPDIWQNIESKKPEPEYEAWYNRLGFGVYAKFSFQSLAKYSL